MPSSTSSFERRKLVGGPWVTTWALALALACAMLGGVERFWRARGLKPTVSDSKELWAHERHKVYRPRTLALVGSSRMIYDIATDVLRARFPSTNVVELAAPGTSGIAVLIDLANDAKFRDASVLVDVDNQHLERSTWNAQGAYIATERRGMTWPAELGFAITAELEGRLVIANPRVGIAGMLESGAPQQTYITIYPDRSGSADYAATDRAKALATRIRRLGEAPRPPDAAEWNRETLGLKPYLQKLASRNVKVAFIRMPTSGEHWAIDERHYPKAEYWDVFEKQIGVPAVHFKDEPALAQFDRLPDGSHVDLSEQAAFTECFADVVARLDLARGDVPSKCQVRTEGSPR